MPRFTAEQKEQAYNLLYRHVRDTNDDPTIIEGAGMATSSELLEQLKARVVLGEELSEVDLLNARNTLSADEQAELRAFIGEES
jgi:hypothetical protein